MDTLVTRNRRLEQFLFMHGIDYISVGKDEDNMTVWEYEATEETQAVINEFRIAKERRQKGAK